MTRKTWNFSLYQTETLHRLLTRLTADFDLGSCALVLPDGKALHVRALHPADTATLAVAASQCHQYLQLKDGDIAICNDPYSGGTRLSDITLVAGVNFENPADGCELLLACRLAFPTRISLNGKLDEEGVRIPPMPLASSGRVNKEILAAISQAPLAPYGFLETIEAAIARIEQIRCSLKACGRDPQGELRKVMFRRYLQDCKTTLKPQIGRLPLGETTVTANLESGELLKLRMEIIDDKIIFDFTGTEPSQRVQLTDLTTYGACFHALAAVLDQPLVANAGTFQLLEVLTPARTWVNAKAPAATSRGVSDGLALVGALALKAFGRLGQTPRGAAGAFGSARVQFDFKDNRLFSDTTPGGSGAGQSQPGIEGWNIWLKGEMEQTSIEATERTFPVLMKSIAVRPGSGGKGKQTGGAGLTKTYSVLAPAHFTWTLEQATSKAEGAGGGKGGQSAEITLQRAQSSEKEELAAEGQLDLSINDIIRIHSAGGGGFGEPEQT